MASGTEFVSLFDRNGIPYYAFNTSIIKKQNLAPRNSSDLLLNSCTFLCEKIEVRRRSTGLFSTDLTDRDDVIIAVLSILLILVIESILTTILLRTDNGFVSNAAFSIRQFVDLVREMRFRHLVRGRPMPNGHRERKRKINIRLLFIASITVLVTFGLEVLVLVLSSPGLTDVTNNDSSFEIVPVMNPDWHEVYYRRDAAVNLPCTAVTFEGVVQVGNQISACLAASLPDGISLEDRFEIANTPVNLTIVTDVHRYGVDHMVIFDDKVVNFTARAVFVLNDGKGRIMPIRRQLHNMGVRVEVMHKQVLAYLFSMYVLKTNDKSMNAERLNNLSNDILTFDELNGPVVNIIQVSRTEQRFRSVTSTRYVTNVNGLIPSGSGAVRFLQSALKGSVSFRSTRGDPYDLIMSNGNTVGLVAVMWQENSRVLNWLSMIIILAGTGVLFVVLRVLLQPTSTTEIAGVCVAGSVNAAGADWLDEGGMAEFWNGSGNAFGEYEDDIVADEHTRKVKRRGFNRKSRGSQ